jgi:Holliday junction resolvasome RuvABC endonuclease subunit
MAKRRRKAKECLGPEHEKIVAFDVASGTGCVFGAGGQVVTWDKFAMATKEAPGERLASLAEWIGKTLRGLPEVPDTILVELPFLGRNAKTFAVLSKYVAVVQCEVFRQLGKECVFMTPREVKSLVKLPKTKSHARQKQNAIRKINKLLGLDLKYIPGKKTAKSFSDDDIADAMLLLIAYWVKGHVLTDVEDVGMI